VFFYTLYVYFISPYFVHDAFMHHTMHVLQSDSPMSKIVPMFSKILLLPSSYT